MKISNILEAKANAFASNERVYAYMQLKYWIAGEYKNIKNLIRFVIMLRFVTNCYKLLRIVTILKNS